MLTGARESLRSHRLVFAAEQVRLRQRGPPLLLHPQDSGGRGWSVGWGSQARKERRIVVPAEMAQLPQLLDPHALDEAVC